MDTDAEFPFDSIETYTVYLEPYLNAHYKEYQQIITIDKQPKGDLSRYVRPINMRPLSPFNTVSALVDPFQCTYAVLRTQHPNMKATQPFLMKQDFPAFVSFLRIHGYHVDMDIIKMMHKADMKTSTNPFTGGKKTVLCSFTYINH